MTKAFTVTQLRCLELSRKIREGLPGMRFDMRDWGHCGTSGCIAGHAVAVYAPDSWELRTRSNIEPVARQLLGLSESEGRRLFTPREPEDYALITPAMAASVLENFALTGKVEWAKT